MLTAPEARETCWSSGRFGNWKRVGRREPGSIHGEVELVPDYLGGRRDVLQYELEQLDQEQHTAIGTLGEGSLGHLLG